MLSFHTGSSGHDHSSRIRSQPSLGHTFKIFQASNEAKVLDVFTKDPVQVPWMWMLSISGSLSAPPGGEGREGAKDERAATPPALGDLVVITWSANDGYGLRTWTMPMNIFQCLKLLAFHVLHLLRLLYLRNKKPAEGMK